MSIPFTRWPEEFARRYREKGYWQDLPLTDILTVLKIGRASCRERV